MRKLPLLTAIALMVHSAQAATFVFPAANYDDLGGKTTETFVISVTDSGVTADISFTFTATAPGHTGTPALAFGENTRLGITSSFDQGAAADTSFNEGEILTLTVSSSITSVPPGQSVTTIEFGIPMIDLVRSGPANGNSSYTWTSSAGTFSSTPNNTTGGQTFETFDGANTFNINGATYTGQLTVTDGGGTTSGPRFDTNQDLSFTTTITTVPEPSSFSLITLGAIALIARRRR